MTAGLKNRGNMMKQQRQILILDYINEKGSVTNNELLERFSVSKATLNRDLTALEAENAIRKVHGGVLSLEAVKTFELPIKKKELIFTEYKEAIAREAMELVRDHQVILLDSGSTTLEIARLIAGRHWDNLTVVSNDIKIMASLMENDSLSLFMLGGERTPQSYNTLGSYTSLPLKNIHVDLLFLGTASFDLRSGVTYVGTEEAELKQAMIRCSDKIALVADSAKYNTVKRWGVCALSELSYIITDERMAKEDREALRAECPCVIIGKRNNEKDQSMPDGKGGER